MALRVAATSEQLACAYFRQGCFDAWNGHRVLKNEDESSFGEALAIAQFSQAVEKALKAYVLLEVEQGTYVQSTHRVWSVDLQSDALNRKARIWTTHFRDGELRKLRTRMQNQLGGPKSTAIIEKLEALTPERDWSRPNSEYPWIDGGTVVCPAEYFHEQLDHFIVLEYAKIADTTIGNIADSSDLLRKEQEDVSKIARNLE